MNDLHRIFNEMAEDHDFDKALVLELVIGSILLIFGVTIAKVYKSNYTFGQVMRHRMLVNE